MISTELGYDPEDFDDILRRVEKSFAIRFKNNELADVRTFGELCDIILTKINLTGTVDSTNQQAFYKLRAAFVAVQRVNRNNVIPQTPLECLFPRQHRRKQIHEVEEYLGFELNVLGVKKIIGILFLVALLTSIVWLFFDWIYGLIGIVSSLLVMSILGKLGKEFQVKTVGELAQKIARENYIKARRNPETINKQEIIQILKELIGEDGFVDSQTIGPETKIP